MNYNRERFTAHRWSPPDRLDRLDVTPKMLKREPVNEHPLEVVQKHVEKQVLLSRSVARWRAFILHLKREVKIIKSQRMILEPSSFYLREEQCDITNDIYEAEYNLNVTQKELDLVEIEIQRISNPIRE